MVLPLLFSALAPGLFGSAMSPLVASALGAGVGGLIESGGDLETGLLTGLGAFAGGSLMGGLAGSGAGAAADAGAAAATGAMGAGATGAGATGLPAGAMASSPIPPPNPMLGASVAPTAGLPGLAGGGGGMFKEGMAFAKSPQGMGVGIGAALGPALAPMFGGGGGGEEKDDRRSRVLGATEMKPMPRDYQMPGAGYNPGVSGEWDYGLGNVPSAGEIIDFRDGRYSDGGLLRRFESMFGPARMAGGGIASLADVGGEQMPPEQVPPEQMAPEQAVDGEQAVILDAVRAIKGESENPQMALGVFLKTFGEDAMRDLVDRVKAGEFEMDGEDVGKVSGEGDGMEDLIPANVDGERDVLLSDGEFVVPADVVSGLGNGSTDAGAQELESMMQRVRQSRTGTPEQPPRVPQDEMMPA